MGETARLTHGQREKHFLTALATERALAELPALREQFLAALARREEDLRAQHTRHMAAATTGEDPEARPHQQDLLNDLPSSVPPQAPKRPKPAPRKEEQPDPEPPKGAARPRHRASIEAKGTRRAETTASARTVAEASPLSADDDAVPAPAVPCCTCGDSLADHADPQGMPGACHARNCAARPRCKAFIPGQVHGWRLHWQGGWRETGEQPVFFLAPADAPFIGELVISACTAGPLFYDAAKRTLIYSDPAHPERLSDALAEARERGSWSSLEGARGVPLRVLEVVAKLLTPSAPEAPALSAEQAPPAPPSAPPAFVPLEAINLEEVSDLRQVLARLKRAKEETPAGSRLRRVLSVLAVAAREESWTYLAGDEQWRVQLHGEDGEVWLSHGTRALCTAGPWRWDGVTLTRGPDWSGCKAMGPEPTLQRLEDMLRTTLEQQMPGATSDGAAPDAGVVGGAA